MAAHSEGLAIADSHRIETRARLPGVIQKRAILEWEMDPDLEGPRGPALRALLYLFERDTAVKLLRSG